MDFTPLFHPKTIAVLGVSLTNDRHPANVIYNKIHLRYPVKVYPVNPRGGQFQRDRVYADISWESREMTLIDTGGLEPRPDSGLRQMVQDQAEVAINEADAIVFLVDVLDGVTLPDSEAAEALRRSQKPIVLAVNKADNDQRRHQAFQFHELGIGEPIAISAYHGTGVADLMDEVSARLPPPFLL